MSIGVFSILLLSFAIFDSIINAKNWAKINKLHEELKEVEDGELEYKISHLSTDMAVRQIEMRVRHLKCADLCRVCQKTMQSNTGQRGKAPKKMPRSRGYCLTTKCPDCGMMFLETIPMHLEDMPCKCSGCGSNLTWNIPYTRLEIDCDDEDFCRCVNVIHRLEWQELMLFHISDALRNVLDEGVKKVEMKIQKVGD